MFGDEFLNWLRPPDLKSLGYQNLLIRGHKVAELNEYTGLYRISKDQMNRDGNDPSVNATGKLNKTKSCLLCQWFKIFEPGKP